jgi:tRNA dimethylallyltransferase
MQIEPTLTLTLSPTTAWCPERELTLSKTARQAVGYKEVIEHLEGKADLPATIEAVKRNTRQLAKRQTTWFRSLSECRFVPAAGKTPEDLAEEIHEVGMRD